MHDMNNDTSASTEPDNNDMDQGEGASAGNNSSTDTTLHQIEHQFSCMATTDKDVLIRELQRMVGENILNEYAAGFFLDMNNWNLQLAVGSYFDLIGNSTTTTTTPTTTIIGSTPAFSATTTTPTTPIQLLLQLNKPTQTSITLMNDGPTRWPPGCSFRFVQGDANLAVVNEGGGVEHVEKVQFSDFNGVEPSATLPIHLTFLLTTQQPNPVQMHWQMCTPDGYLFGKLIHFVVSVEDFLENQFSSLRTE